MEGGGSRCATLKGGVWLVALGSDARSLLIASACEGIISEVCESKEESSIAN